MTEKQRTKQQVELMAWFRREAEPLANNYEAALRFLEDKNFPNRISLIAHQLRDLTYSLPEILEPMSRRDRVEYEQHLNEISPNWLTVPNLESAEIENPSKMLVSISMNVALQIEALIQDHRKSHEVLNHVDILFRILMRNHPFQADVNLKIIHDFKDIHRTFVKWSKKRTLMKRSVDEDELCKQFRKFENILYSFVGCFFEGTERLDEFLRQGVQPDQIDELFTLIASPHHEAYFFNNLNDHKLIPFLKGRGMFEKPSKKEIIRGVGVRFPAWPPSRYLARMVPASPDEVAEIFSKMTTDNSSVVRDIVSAALSAPVKTAGKLIPKICWAAKNNLLVLCFEEASTLCVKLAEMGDVHSAELLAIALFTPQMKSYKRSLWYELQYREGLEKVVAVLAPVSTSSRFLEKLCVWLHLFIESEHGFDPESDNDYSFLWRPAIEDDAKNHDYHRASPMVAFVRNGFELAIENKRMSINTAFKIIDGQNYLIFKRIKLHLINKFAEQDFSMARAIILNRDFFEQDKYKHEYANLVENHFSLLSESECHEWFAWTESGLHADELKNAEGNASEELISKRMRYWKYRKLHCARNYLTNSRKRVYESLREEFGSLALSDLNISSYAGMLESPIKIEDLSKLSFKEAVKTVSEWYLSGQSLSGIEELANAFQEYIAAKAVAFSREARELISHPAIFISKFVGAMSDAIKMGCDIDINAVLDLCLWAVSLSESAKERADKHWSWVRSKIALFMKAVCQATESDSPKYSMGEFQNRLWRIISCLCLMREDAVFLIDTTADPRSEDYIQIGINSLKGQAAEAVLEYARWVFIHFTQLPGKADYGELAEVMSLIETRMFAEDRTPGELAMIGANIHLLYSIDKFWLQKLADAIFPLESNDLSPSGLEWASWNAFLCSSRPHIEFYRLFKKQFAYAVKHAPSIRTPKNDTAHNPVYRLGEHLVILYMQGELQLESEELSLRTFLSEAKLDIRLHTIEFLGRVLEHHSEISEGVEKRCVALWELYWNDKGNKDARQVDGCWPFVSWLACRKFPKGWCLEQFEKYLQAAENPEISSWTMEELAWISDVDFKKSVNMLNRIIQNDKEGWHMPGWQDSIYVILKAALAKDRACIQSHQLIDYLGRSGYMNFSKLVLR